MTLLRKSLVLTALALCGVAPSDALRLEPIKYADFSNWVTRDIQESRVIGGNRKTVYAIGPNAHQTGNKPFRQSPDCHLTTSNVYAHVAGVSKASNTVSPAVINGNKVAKLECKMETVRALGIINIDVMVAGTIFLGKIVEPITSPKGPYSKMSMGMPYTKRPTALVYDFKVDMPNVNSRVKSTGFSPKKTLPGRDNAEVYVLLQHRWEDAKGNIYARRVGTGRERYSRNVPWTRGHRLMINYGDISKKPGYKPWMGLLDGEKAYYAFNSKGKLMPVHEIGWADENETPTHVLMMASSSCGEAYIGTEGVTLYIDNIAFGF